MINTETLEKIKSLGGNNGQDGMNMLLEFYNADGLREISQKQAERFYYEKLKVEVKNGE